MFILSYFNIYLKSIAITIFFKRFVCLRLQRQFKWQIMHCDIRLATLKPNESQSSLYKTKATRNLAVIPPIRFKHTIEYIRIRFCATKWLETMPLLCEVYSDALSQLHAFSMAAYVYICGHGNQPTFLDSRSHSSLWWPFARIGRVHHLWQIFHVFRSGRSFLVEDEEIRARTRISRDHHFHLFPSHKVYNNNICLHILFFQYIARMN